MTITVNGQKKEVPDRLTVLGLLQFLKIQPERVAVERNLKIVKKDQYDATDIKEGDDIEIVTFMAGGAGA
jgi:thiamine biosynthesis protein ThiS